jgi:NAD(P)H-flavin reductase
MHTGTGRIVELLLEDECLYGRISCAPSLVPAPGQYLLAGRGSDSLLPVPLFHTDSAPQGFICPVPETWKPGDLLSLRGPLGRGFSLPISARKVGLVAFDCPPSRLHGLVALALRQNASVVLLCDSSADHLPDEVEVQPLSALDAITQWADFLALDVDRENIRKLVERLEDGKPGMAWQHSQILVRAPMPCGGIAECGICALTTNSEWKMACKDGPVFNLTTFSTRS